MKYRIKQIEPNKFVPQVKECFFFKWASITAFKHIDAAPRLTYGRKGEDLCYVKTKNEALQHINVHAEYIEKMKQFPIIHKVKKNPLI